MKIFVDYANEQDKPPLDGIETLIEDCARTALTLENIDRDAEVSVTLVDNARIRELNARFREIDRETDVLSFPASDGVHFDIDPDTNAIILGDIVISLEKAEEQANEYGHSIRRETAFLITHSLFHLLGYDHMTPDEETEMFARQEKVLEELGITR